MEPITSTRAIGLFSLIFLLFLPLLFLILKRHFLSSPSPKRQPFPPGPKPWPVVGNLLHMAMGKAPHIMLTNLAKVHGPLISLRLGTQLLVVGSSPAAATEILKTHDSLLSGRSLPKLTPIKGTDLSCLSVIGADCNVHWKFLRNFCRVELFSAKAIESQAILWQRKINEMVMFLGSKQGKVVKIAEAVFAVIFNTLANIVFSKDFIDFEDNGARGLKGLIWKMSELAATPNLAEFYPIFEGLDLQSLNRKTFDIIQQVYDTWEDIIKERQESSCHDATKQHDLLDVMLENNFTTDQIKHLALELFSAGTDTTTSTIEWAMAELLKNREAMNKVSEELIKREFNQNSIIAFDISQFPYLNACVKETLRLHPPGPFLIPHRALETCEVMNYTIPKNAKVLVNIWAAGRDAASWEDPFSFKPDRFLNVNLDYKGQDFKFIPFGAGRRMCPGLPMATKLVHLIVATLIHSFDWSLPNGEDPTQLDMNEKLGVTMQMEKPLLLIPK